MKMEREMARAMAMLDAMGVPYEVHNPYISFPSPRGHGDCWIFPSQTYDGLLTVQHIERDRVTSAEEALRACGLAE